MGIFTRKSMSKAPEKQDPMPEPEEEAPPEGQDPEEQDPDDPPDDTLTAGAAAKIQGTCEMQHRDRPCAQLGRIIWV
jgi:hypothetical protein